MGMRFTIEGFSQKRAIDLGLTAEDLVILRWFVDFYPSPEMVKLEHKGKTYALVNYSGFISQMPIVGCNKRTIARKFQHLVESNVLEHIILKKGGTFSLYKFGRNYKSLVSDQSTEVETEETEETEETGDGVGGETQDRDHIDYEAFHTVYNDTCTNLPKCAKLTEKRKNAIRNFLKEYTLDDWKEVCRRANTSPFLIGKNERGWKADFDFLLRIDKATKILEKGYSSDYRDKYTYNSENTGEVNFSSSSWEV